MKCESYVTMESESDTNIKSQSERENGKWKCYRQLKVSQLQGHLSDLNLEEWMQLNAKVKIC